MKKILFFFLLVFMNFYFVFFVCYATEINVKDDYGAKGDGLTDDTKWC